MTTNSPQRIGPAHFRGFTGPQDGYYVMADGLEVFGRRIGPFKVACCPCDPDFEIDGLLGLDFFRDLVVTMDFKRGRFSMSPDGIRTPTANGPLMTGSYAEVRTDILAKPTARRRTAGRS